ncbi:MAG: OsmC family protein [Nitrospirota bacterium]
MADQLEVTVDSTNQRMGFTSALRSLPPIAMDYIPPLGDGQGYTPLELLLMSLSACSGSTVSLLLRKAGKNILDVKVTARGTRREQHPTSFQSIALKFNLTSADITDADVQKAIRMSEESVCPVWAMLKNSVEITTEYKIIS